MLLLRLEDAKTTLKRLSKLNLLCAEMLLISRKVCSKENSTVLILICYSHCEIFITFVPILDQIGMFYFPSTMQLN